MLTLLGGRVLCGVTDDLRLVPRSYAASPLRESLHDPLLNVYWVAEYCAASLTTSGSSLDPVPRPRQGSRCTIPFKRTLLRGASAHLAHCTVENHVMGQLQGTALGMRLGQVNARASTYRTEPAPVTRVLHVAYNCMQIPRSLPKSYLQTRSTQEMKRRV